MCPQWWRVILPCRFLFSQLKRKLVNLWTYFVVKMVTYPNPFPGSNFERDIMKDSWTVLKDGHSFERVVQMPWGWTFDTHCRITGWKALYPQVSALGPCCWGHARDGRRWLMLNIEVLVDSLQATNTQKTPVRLSLWWRRCNKWNSPPVCLYLQVIKIPDTPQDPATEL